MHVGDAIHLRHPGCRVASQTRTGMKLTTDRGMLGPYTGNQRPTERSTNSGRRAGDKYHPIHYWFTRRHPECRGWRAAGLNGKPVLAQNMKEMQQNAIHLRRTGCHLASQTGNGLGIPADRGMLCPYTGNNRPTESATNSGRRSGETYGATE